MLPLILQLIFTVFRHHFSFFTNESDSKVNDCYFLNVSYDLTGEDIFLICELKRLRISKDWVGDQWVDINAKPDILSAASSVSPRTKLASCSVIIKGAESGSSVMSDQEFITAHPNLVEDKQAEASLSCRNSVQLDNESQSNPRKRHREENAQDGCGVGTGIGDAES